MAGVRVVWAGNHWRIAVDTHAENHPEVEHACRDLREFAWCDLPSYDLLLASPACQGHSRASRPRRRPYHDALRATAWAVVDCAETTRPRALIVENVPDFARWELFPIWREALVRLGYRMSSGIVRASYLGVPQRRDRFFIVGVRRGKAADLDILPTKEPPFGPCIDWDAPGWRAVDDAAPGARGRINAALQRFDRCLVQHVTGHRGISLDEPIRTITTQDQWILVDADRFRPLTTREHARAMGFPDTFKWSNEIPRWAVLQGIGNAVPPRVAKTIIERAVA